jgi:hypothetical protein
MAGDWRDAVRAVLTEPVFRRPAAATASAPRTGIGRLAVESLHVVT